MIGGVLVSTVIREVRAGVYKMDDGTFRWQLRNGVESRAGFATLADAIRDIEKRY